MRTFSHLALTPCAPFFGSAGPFGGFELLSRLSHFHEHMIAMISTSDQSCWLAKACTILLLLLKVRGDVP